MFSDSGTGPAPGDPGPTAQLTPPDDQDIHHLLSAAIMRRQRKGTGCVIDTMADLRRLAIRLEIYAKRVARRAPKQAFDLTLSSVYAIERAELRVALAGLYNGSLSLAEARAVLCRIKATVAKDSGVRGRTGLVENRQI